MQKSQERKNHDVLTPLPKTDAPSSGPLNLESFEVCDIEATTWTNFLIIGHFDGTEYREFVKLPAYIEFLARKAEDAPEGKLTVFAHYGGGYDFSFLIDAIFFNSPYMIGNIIERGSGILSLEMQGKRGQQKIKIIFRDSTALLPFSLKKITETFGVAHKKKEMDHTRVTKVTKKLREYLRYDCVGLYESLQKYFHWWLFDGVEVGYTVAGQAMRLWRKYIDEPIFAIKEPAIDDFIRGAYFGGRTEIFKPWFDGRRMSGHPSLKCYDCNSLYPTAMKLHDYPIAFSHETEIYEEGELGIYDVEVKIPNNMWCPPIPILHAIKKTNKLIFPTGRFKARLTNWEIDYCRKLGIQIKTGYGIVFINGGKIFKPYVDELYAIRKQSPAGSIDDILSKLYMNGLYGRTALRLDREELIVDDGRDNVEPHMVIQGPSGKKIAFVKHPKRIKAFTNAAIATFVTAGARLYMHPFYLECDRDLYYTDTDSLFTTQTLPTGKNLGEMKLEYECDAACFLLPKTYIAHHTSKEKLKEWQPDPGMSIKDIAQKLYHDSSANTLAKLKEYNPDIISRYWKRWPEWKSLKFKTRDKVAMKGFMTRKITHFKLEDFHSALEGELRALHVTMPPKFAKLRSAGRRGKFLTMLPASPRTIRTKYDKREIIKFSNGTYDSKPLCLSI